MESEEAFSFLIPFLFRELEGERREEAKKKSQENSRLSPYCGHYRSLLWVLPIQFYDIKNIEENQEKYNYLRHFFSVFSFFQKE